MNSNPYTLQLPRSRDDRETSLPVPTDDWRAFLRAALLHVGLLSLPSAYLTWLMGTSLSLMGASAWPGIGAFWSEWSVVLVTIAALIFPMLALMLELRGARARRQARTRLS